MWWGTGQMYAALPAGLMTSSHVLAALAPHGDAAVAVYLESLIAAGDKTVRLLSLHMP
jgi:hypothetical protein